MEEKDEIIISLSDVWNIIKKNAAFIIIVTLICAIGSFFITRIHRNNDIEFLICLY